MSDRRKAEFREVRDERTGKLMGRINPHTLEFEQERRGRTMRAKLTEHGLNGYPNNEREETR